MVDREVDVPNVIKAMCELPIDMILLAISFLIAIVISDEASRNQAVLYFVTFFILSLVIVFMSKRSVHHFEGGKYRFWFALLLLNFLVALICLIGSVTFVIHHAPVNFKENKISKTTLNGN
jgi:hypothetical protein